MALKVVQGWFGFVSSSTPSAAQLESRNGVLILPQESVVIDEINRQGNKLGEGTFAKVYVGMHMGKERAIKVFNGKSDSIVDKAWEEYEKLNSLKHPNIVRVYGMWEDPHKKRNAPAIVMELCDHSLHDYVEQYYPRSSITREHKLKILHDITCAMVFLHSKNVVHGDLRSPNVLVQRINDEVTAKLTDFGMARMLDPQDNSHVTKTTADADYLPPEVFNHEDKKDRKKNWAKLTTQVDVFMFGPIAIELACGEFPKPTLKHEIRKGSVTRTYSEIERREQHLAKVKTSDRAITDVIVKQCLAENPEDRETFLVLQRIVKGFQRQKDQPDSADHFQDLYEEAQEELEGMRSQLEADQKSLYQQDLEQIWKDEMKQLQDAYDDLKDAKDTLKKQFKEKVEEIATSQKEREVAETQLNEVKEKQDRTQGELEMRKDAWQTLQQEYSKKLESHTTLNQDYDKLKANAEQECKTKDNAIDSWKQKCETTQTQLTVQISKLEHERDQVRSELEIQTTERKTLHEDYTEKVATLADLTEKHQKFTEEYKALVLDHRKMTEEHRKLIEKNNTLELDHRRMKEEYTEEKDHIKQLEETVRLGNEERTRLAQQLSAEKTACTQTEAELEKSKEKVTGLETVLQESGKQSEVFKHESQKKDEEITLLKQNCEDTAAQLTVKLSQVEEQRDQAQRKLGDLEQASENSRKDFQVKVQAFEDLRKQFDELKHGHSTLEFKLQQTQSDYEIEQKNCDRERDTTKGLRTEIAQLKGSLSSLDADLKAKDNRIASLNQECSAAKAELGEQLSEAQSKLKMLESANEELQDNYDKQATTLGDLRLQLGDLQGLHRKLEEERSNYEDRIKQLQEANQASSGERINLSDQLKEEKAKYEQMVQELNRQKDDMKNTHESSEEMLQKEKMKDKQAWDEKKHELERKVATLQLGLAAYQHEAASVSDISRLKEMSLDQKKRLKTLQDELDEIKGQLTQTTVQAANYRSSCLEKEKELKAQKDELEKTNSELECLKQECKKWQQEKDSDKGAKQHKELQRLFETFKVQSGHTEKDLKKANKDLEQSKIVAESLQKQLNNSNWVKSKLENEKKALEEKVAGLEKEHARLKAAEGRLAALQVEQEKTTAASLKSKEQELRNVKGELEKASSEAKAKEPSFRKLQDINRSLEVEIKKVKDSLLRKEKELKSITDDLKLKERQLIEVKRHGPAQKKLEAEKEELKKTLAGLEAVKMKLESDKTELEEKITLLQDSNRTLETEKNELEEKVLDLKSRNDALGAQLESLKNDRHAVAEERDSLRQDMALLVEEKVALKEQVNQLEDEKNRSVTEAQRSLDLASTTEQSLQASVTEHAMAIQDLTEKLSRREVLFNDVTAKHTAFEKENSRQIADLTEQIGGKESDLKDAIAKHTTMEEDKSKEIAGLTKELDAKSAELTELNAAVERNKGVVEDARENFKDLQKRSKELTIVKAKLNEAEEKIRNLQGKLNEAGEQIRNLQGELTEVESTKYQNAELKEALEKKTSQLKDVERREMHPALSESAALELKKKTDEVTLLQSEIAKLKVKTDQVTHLQNEIAKLKVKTDQVTHLQNEIAKLKVKTDQVTHLQNEIAKLKGQMLTAQSDMKTWQEKFIAADAERDSRTNELLLLKGKLQEVTKESHLKHKEWEKKTKVLQEQEDCLKREIKDITSSLQQAFDKASAFETEKQDLKVQIEGQMRAAQSNLKKCEVKLQTVQERCQMLEKDYDHEKEAARGLKATNARLTKEKQELESNKSAVNAQLRNVRDEARKRRSALLQCIAALQGRVKAYKSDMDKAKEANAAEMAEYEDKVNSVKVQLTKTLTAVVSESEAATRRSLELTEENKQVWMESKDLNRTNAVLHQKLMKLENQAADAKEEVNRLEGLLECRSKELSSVKDEHDNVRDEARKSRSALLQCIAALQGRVKACKSDMDKAKEANAAEMAEYEYKVNSVKVQLTKTLTAVVSESKAAIRRSLELTEENKQVWMESKDLNRSNAVLHQKLLKLENQAADAKEEVKRLEGLLECRSKELDSGKNELGNVRDVAEKRRSALLQCIADLQGRVKACKSDLDKAKNANAAEMVQYEDEFHSVKEQLKKKLIAVASEFQAAVRRSLELAEEQGKVQIKNRELHQTNASLQQRWTTSNNQAMEAQSEVQRLKELFESLNRDLDSVKDELDDKSSQRREALQTVEQLKAFLSTKTDDLQVATEHAKDLVLSLEECTIERDSLRSSYNKESQQCKDLEATVQDLNGKVTNLEAEKGNLRVTNDEIRRTNMVLLDDLKRQAVTIDYLEKDNASCHEKVQIAEAALSDCREELAAKAEEGKAQGRTVYRLCAELRSKQELLVFLSCTILVKDDEIQALRMHLESAKFVDAVVTSSLECSWAADARRLQSAQKNCEQLRVELCYKEQDFDTVCMNLRLEEEKCSKLKHVNDEYEDAQLQLQSDKRHLQEAIEDHEKSKASMQGSNDELNDSNASLDEDNKTLSLSLEQLHIKYESFKGEVASLSLQYGKAVAERDMIKSECNTVRRHMADISSENEALVKENRHLKKIKMTANVLKTKKVELKHKENKLMQQSKEADTRDAVLKSKEETSDGQRKQIVLAQLLVRKQSSLQTTQEKFSMDIAANAITKIDTIAESSIRQETLLQSFTDSTSSKIDASVAENRRTVQQIRRDKLDSDKECQIQLTAFKTSLGTELQVILCQSQDTLESKFEHSAEKQLQIQKLMREQVVDLVLKEMEKANAEHLRALSERDKMHAKLMDETKTNSDCQKEDLAKQHKAILDDVQKKHHRMLQDERTEFTRDLARIKSQYEYSLRADQHKCEKKPLEFVSLGDFLAAFILTLPFSHAVTRPSNTGTCVPRKELSKVCALPGFEIVSSGSLPPKYSGLAPPFYACCTRAVRHLVEKILKTFNTDPFQVYSVGFLKSSDKVYMCRLLMAVVPRMLDFSEDKDLQPKLLYTLARMPLLGKGKEEGNQDSYRDVLFEPKWYTGEPRASAYPFTFQNFPSSLHHVSEQLELDMSRNLAESLRKALSIK